MEDGPSCQGGGGGWEFEPENATKRIDGEVEVKTKKKRSNLSGAYETMSANAGGEMGLVYGSNEREKPGLQG